MTQLVIQLVIKLAIKLVNQLVTQLVTQLATIDEGGCVANKSVSLQVLLEH